MRPSSCVLALSDPSSPRYYTASFPPGRIGLGLVDRGGAGEPGVKVMQIVPGGSAAGVGTISKGDHLVAINHMRVDHAHREEVVQMLAEVAQRPFEMRFERKNVVPTIGRSTSLHAAHYLPLPGQEGLGVDVDVDGLKVDLQVAVDALREILETYPEYFNRRLAHRVTVCNEIGHCLCHRALQEAAFAVEAWKDAVEAGEKMGERSATVGEDERCVDIRLHIVKEQGQIEENEEKARTWQDHVALMERQGEAAHVLQRGVRCHVARQTVKKVRDAVLLKARAATNISKMRRGFLDRRRIERVRRAMADLRSETEGRAAVTMQCRARSFLSRTKMARVDAARKAALDAELKCLATLVEMVDKGRLDEGLDDMLDVLRSGLGAYHKDRMWFKEKVDAYQEVLDTTRPHFEKDDTAGEDGANAADGKKTEGEGGFEDLEALVTLDAAAEAVECDSRLGVNDFNAFALVLTALRDTHVAKRKEEEERARLMATVAMFEVQFLRLMKRSGRIVGVDVSAGVWIVRLAHNHDVIVADHPDTSGKEQWSDTGHPDMAQDKAYSIAHTTCEVRSRAKCHSLDISKMY